MKLKDILKGVLSLMVLIALIVIAWTLLTSMIKVFGDYTSSVEPTIVVAILSGLVAIIVNAISKNGERKNDSFSKSKDKMMPIYEDFLMSLSSARTEEMYCTVFSKFEPIFAINSSDDTYNEFLLIKEKYEKTKTVDTKRFTIAARKELKVSNKRNPAKATEKDDAKSVK